MIVKRTALMISLLLSGCQTTPDFLCIKGIVFVQTIRGLSWLPNQVGNPVTCIEFGDIPVYDVPEEMGGQP